MKYRFHKEWDKGPQADLEFSSSALNIEHLLKELKSPVTVRVAHACVRKFWPAGPRGVQLETLTK